MTAQLSSLRISKPTLLMAAMIAASGAILAPSRPLDALIILLPILAACLLCAYCITAVWRKDGEIPILDIGVLCVIFTTLYTVIPLANFYLGGLEFGLLSDARLQQHRPSAEELARFFVNHIAYLGALVFAYQFFRRSNRSLPHSGIERPRSLTVNVVMLVFLTLLLYFAVLRYAFGIGFKSGYGDESEMISTGPMWLQQLNGKLSEIKFVFQAAAVGYLVYRKNDFRIRLALSALILWNILDAFLNPGSRGELMSLLLLTFLFWHKFHGAPWKFTLIFLPTAFAAFMFLGLLRSFLDLNDLRLALDAFETLASATNEFQAILGTGYDVHKMIENGVDIPFMLTFNDFAPMLPPQQLWPFEKLAAADWYLIEIGQDGTGVGYMWSVISQSLIGGGIVDLVVRGALLGWFLAYIHHWYQRRYTKFLPTVLYTVLCLTTLWTFRDTTGAILWTIWWALIPFVLLFYFIGLKSEFARMSRPPMRSQQAPSPVAGTAHPV